MPSAAARARRKGPCSLRRNHLKKGLIVRVTEHNERYPIIRVDSREKCRI